MIAFESKEDFERWWDGPEMVDMRVISSGWWQVPVLYAWHDLGGAGEIGGERQRRAAAGARAGRRRRRLSASRVQPCSSGAIVSPESHSCSQ